MKMHFHDSMALGIIFDIGTLDNYLTVDFKDEIQTETEHSWDVAFGATFDMACTDLPEGETGVGLY